MQQISLFSLPGASEDNDNAESESDSDQDSAEDEGSSEDSDSAPNQNKKRAQFTQITNFYGRIHACLQDNFATMRCECDRSHVVYLELPTQLEDKNQSNNNKKLLTLLFAYNVVSPTHPIQWCIMEFEPIAYVDSSLHLIDSNKSRESLPQSGESSVAEEIKQPIKQRTVRFLGIPDRRDSGESKDSGDSGFGGLGGLRSSGISRYKSDLQFETNPVALMHFTNIHE
jgi:hypothetical protein